MEDKSTYAKSSKFIKEALGRMDHNIRGNAAKISKLEGKLEMLINDRQSVPAPAPPPLDVKIILDSPAPEKAEEVTPEVTPEVVAIETARITGRTSRIIAVIAAVVTIVTTILTLIYTQ